MPARHHHLGDARARHPGVDAHGWRQVADFPGACNDIGRPYHSGDPPDFANEGPGGRPQRARHTRRGTLLGTDSARGTPCLRPSTSGHIATTVRIARTPRLRDVQTAFASLRYTSDSGGRSTLHIPMGLRLPSVISQNCRAAHNCSGRSRTGADSLGHAAGAPRHYGTAQLRHRCCRIHSELCTPQYQLCSTAHRGQRRQAL